MVLRWKRSSSAPAPESNTTQLNNSANAPQQFANRSVGNQRVTAAQAFQESPTYADKRSAVEIGNSARDRKPVTYSNNGNPLRTVQQVAYQQPVNPPQAGGQFADPFGDAPAANPQQGLPELPNLGNEFNNGAQLGDQPQPGDPLGRPEAPPAPEFVEPNINNRPFQNAPSPGDLRDSAAPSDDVSPFDRSQSTEPEAVQLPESDSSLPQLPGRGGVGANALSCNELREQVRSRPISNVSLNVSPQFGQGLRRGDPTSNDKLNDFASNSENRPWADYKGNHFVTGRMVDMKDNVVFIEADGVTRTIPYLDLSDDDVAYISKAWNIPGACGTGYEKFVGRNFVPSQVQWTASGLCHKPAYFEDPQLERYGHEVGPVLQPLLSTAHFFGNVAILPYKMGIHPPNECQYSLGYIRPGNCAPYMMQPFPWSLRGAAAQAGFVTGAAALIP